MLISELIAKLEEIKAEHGDLPIYTDVHDGAYQEPVNEWEIEVRQSTVNEGSGDKYPLRVLIW